MSLRIRGAAKRKQIVIRLSDKERALITKKANVEGQATAVFIRETALMAAIGEISAANAGISWGNEIQCKPPKMPLYSGCAMTKQLREFFDEIGKILESVFREPKLRLQSSILSVIDLNLLKYHNAIEKKVRADRRKGRNIKVKSTKMYHKLLADAEEKLAVLERTKGELIEINSWLRKQNVELHKKLEGLR